MNGVVRETVYSGPTTTYLIELAPGVTVSVLEQNTDRSRMEDRWSGGESVRSAGSPSTAWSWTDRAHRSRPTAQRRNAPMNHDVIVLGAGLAGLAAARDLTAAGADVLVARSPRPGRRTRRADRAARRPAGPARRRSGRPRPHRLPRAGAGTRPHPLPSYVAEPGRMARATAEGISAGDPPHWFGPGDEAVPGAGHRRLRRPGPDRRPARPLVPPATRPPWTACRSATGCAPKERARPSYGSGRSASSPWPAAPTNAPPCSPRSASTPPSPATTPYAYEDWEGLRVAEGSATVALRMAEQLGGAHPAGRARRRGHGAPGRLPGPAGRRGDADRGRRGQRPAGRPAPLGRRHRCLRRPARLAAPPAAGRRRQVRRRLRQALLARPATSTGCPSAKACSAAPGRRATASSPP